MPVHPQPRSYLHEHVRLRGPDAPWTAYFLHELALRERLDARVRQARLWLPRRSQAPIFVLFNYTLPQA